MSEDINLLSKRKSNFTKNKKLAGFFRLASIILLVITVFSSLAIFFLKSNSNLTSLEKEEKAVYGELTRLNQKVAKLLLIERKIKDISTIIEKRPKFDEKINLITKDMPNNVSVASLTVDQKNLSVTLSSSSIYFLNLYLDSFLSSANKKVFSKVTLDSLTLDNKSGRYFLSLKADLL